MDDAGAKLGSDRDYRKETQSDEFGRSGFDPNLAPGAFIFRGAGRMRSSAITCKNLEVFFRYLLIP